MLSLKWIFHNIGWHEYYVNLYQNEITKLKKIRCGILG